jgi:hypothetical protein
MRGRERKVVGEGKRTEEGGRDKGRVGEKERGKRKTKGRGEEGNGGRECGPQLENCGCPLALWPFGMGLVVPLGRYLVESRE